MITKRATNQCQYPVVSKTRRKPLHWNALFLLISFLASAICSGQSLTTTKKNAEDEKLARTEWVGAVLTAKGGIIFTLNADGTFSTEPKSPDPMTTKWEVKGDLITLEYVIHGPGWKTFVVDRLRVTQSRGDGTGVLKGQSKGRVEPPLELINDGNHLVELQFKKLPARKLKDPASSDDQKRRQPDRAIRNESVSPALPDDGEIPYGAAWSGNGSEIAWGNRDDGGASINADRSFEHTFQLDELSFGDDINPDEPEHSGFQKTPPERPDARLQPDGPDAIQVRRGDKLLSKIQLQPTEQGRLTCMSVLPGNRAVIGTSSGLYLYDILTGKLLRTFFGHRGTIHTVSPSPDGRWVLTTCDDKTLRIWSPGSDEPLLSLFFRGSQWIAWTPEGYYACSPGGERLIGWNFVPEKNGEPQYYPASFFHKTLYRPDVISRLLKEGSLDKALQEADGEAGRDTIKTAADEILPPLVTIQSPEADSRSAESEITVRASAKSPGGQPIHSMKLLVNGRPFRGKAGEIEFDPTEVEPTANWTIPLENGRTSLQVVASSTVSQGTSAEVNVSYASPARPGVEEFLPRLYVVAVGISAYQSEELRLNYAAQDAEAISKAFETYSKPLFRSIEVRKLTDGEATADSIRKALSWLKANVTQRDVAVFYFSGHGEKDNDGTLYFLPADADPDDLFSSAIPSEVLTRGLGSCPGRVLLMLDACHAGGIEAANRRKGGLTDDLVRDLVRDESGMVVMCSSTGKEASVESNLLKLGTFTAAVVEGMSGLRIDTGKPSGILSADDGTVYLHHLDAYVTDRVKELTGGKQRPVTDKPATISSFPLTQPDQGK